MRKVRCVASAPSVSHPTATPPGHHHTRPDRHHHSLPVGKLFLLTTSPTEPRLSSVSFFPLSPSPFLPLLRNLTSPRKTAIPSDRSRRLPLTTILLGIADHPLPFPCDSDTPLPAHCARSRTFCYRTTNRTVPHRTAPHHPLHLSPLVFFSAFLAHPRTALKILLPRDPIRPAPANCPTEFPSSSR